MVLLSQRSLAQRVLATSRRSHRYWGSGWVISGPQIQSLLYVYSELGSGFEYRNWSHRGDVSQNDHRLEIKTSTHSSTFPTDTWAESLAQRSRGLGLTIFVRFTNCKCHHCTLGYKLLALTFHYQPAQYWWYPCYDKCHLLNSRVSASNTVQNANRAAPGQHDQCQLHAAAHGDPASVTLEGKTWGSSIWSCGATTPDSFLTWGI